MRSFTDPSKNDTMYRKLSYLNQNSMKVGWEEVMPETKVGVMNKRVGYACYKTKNN